MAFISPSAVIYIDLPANQTALTETLATRYYSQGGYAGIGLPQAPEACQRP
jgi:hypothetical protein